MEPMTLGSPSGSPGSNPNYLPSFLMGEQTPNARNTLSPKGNYSFGQSTGGGSASQDVNRTHLGQKTLFSNFPQSPTAAAVAAASPSTFGTPIQNHNSSISGPPTQGLFDSLRNERNQLQTSIQSTAATPERRHLQQQQQFNSPFATTQNLSIGMNPQQFNESLYGNTSYNASSSRFITSPTPSAVYGTPNMNYTSNVSGSTSLRFWITVFGFPSSAINMILQHFSQCGTIVEKVLPPQNANWIHIKFSSRLECEKALNYNEKILGNNMMIGVTQCKDASLADKENLNETMPQTRIRPLAKTAYNCAQNDSVETEKAVPQKSSGFVSKAFDLFLGW